MPRPKHAQGQEAVMAGDGGRAPDVSEQRAALEAWVCPTHGIVDEGELAEGVNWSAGPTMDGDVAWTDRYYCQRDHADDQAHECELRRLTPLDDPTSVLAALLAEHPDATIAALETLLTSDEATGTAAAKALYPILHAVSLGDSPEALLGHAVRVSLSAACRSLRPKAPKEDRDA